VQALGSFSYSNGLQAILIDENACVAVISAKFCS
jgi:hypothetical protein